MPKATELPYPHKIRTTGEKETTFWGTFEADTIKQVEIKEKIEGKREKYFKPNYKAEISSKG